MQYHQFVSAHVELLARAKVLQMDFGIGRIAALTADLSSITPLAHTSLSV